MEVKFSPNFFDSFGKIARTYTWWYKTYSFFRYDMPRFFRNIWRFRKELYDFHSWESMYQLAMLRRGLELNADYLEKYGLEVEHSRNKKVKMIRRAVQIMKWHENDDFLELAEKELGYGYIVGKIEFEETGEETENPLTGKKEKLFSMLNNLDEETERINKLISDKSTEIEAKTWKELFTILQGQDYTEFKDIIHSVGGNKEDSDEPWDNWFDGSGMKVWWD